MDTIYIERYIRMAHATQWPEKKQTSMLGKTAQPNKFRVSRERFIVFAGEFNGL